MAGQYFRGKASFRTRGSSGAGPLGWRTPHSPKQKRAAGALCISSVFYVCLFVFFPLWCVVFKVWFLLPFSFLFFNRKYFNGGEIEVQQRRTVPRWIHMASTATTASHPKVKNLIPTDVMQYGELG